MAARMPTLYIPHGGGPWPFMDTAGFMAEHERDALLRFTRGLPARLPARPAALLVISAHWEAPVPTVSTHPSPPMVYDYYGFPPSTYTLRWPAPGAPGLAARVRALLGAAGVRSAEEPVRGFDHGTFIPLMLAYPEADVPTVQLALQAGLDPATHLAIGRAVAPLRDEGVLILGSGMSFHNLRAFGHPPAVGWADTFDAWLREAVTSDPEARDATLRAWERAPFARLIHPREEHLLPLMVVAGAAGNDVGAVPFGHTVAGMRISAAAFGVLQPALAPLPPGVATA